MQDAALKLSRKPQDYYYLSQSGVVSDPSIDDAGDWGRIEEALGAMAFTPQQQKDLCGVLAAILHMGNIKFAQVTVTRSSNISSSNNKNNNNNNNNHFFSSLFFFFCVQ